MYERVRELFDYHKDGYLIWKISTANRVRIGDVAGVYHKHTGYYYVRFDNKLYKLHRIIWLWHYGYLPENVVDHIDQNKINNRINNLSDKTQQCNTRNRGAQNNSTTGIKGVSLDRQRNKFHSFITIDGKTFSLGRYTNFEEAVCVRLAAEQCLNWDSCESFSTAFQYIQDMLKYKN